MSDNDDGSATPPMKVLLGLEEWRQSIEDRLDRGSHRMDGLQRELHQNTKATEQLGVDVTENTRLTNEVLTATNQIRELFEMGKTGMRVLNWIGRAFTAVVRWVGWMSTAAVAIAALVYWLRNGGPPK